MITSEKTDRMSTAEMAVHAGQNQLGQRGVFRVPNDMNQAVST